MWRSDSHFLHDLDDIVSFVPSPIIRTGLHLSYNGTTKWATGVDIHIRKDLATLFFAFTVNDRIS